MWLRIVVEMMPKTASRCFSSRVKALMVLLVLYVICVTLAFAIYAIMGVSGTYKTLVFLGLFVAPYYFFIVKSDFVYIGEKGIVIGGGSLIVWGNIYAALYNGMPFTGHLDFISLYHPNGMTVVPLLYVSNKDRGALFSELEKHLRWLEISERKKGVMQIEKEK